MAFPEVLREDLVDEIVGRVLDHLDLFEDHLLLALDLVGGKRRTQHDVREQVDGERQVLVEHLDVVAGVFLGGERSSWPPIESIACAMSSADRVSVPLKSMCSTKCAMPLRSSLSCRDPRVSQTPMVTDRTCGIVSVMSRSPLSRTSRTTMCRGCAHRSLTCPRIQRKALICKELQAPESRMISRRQCAVQEHCRIRRSTASCRRPAPSIRSAGDRVVQWSSLSGRLAMTDTSPTRHRRPRTARTRRGARALGHPRFHARQIFQWIHKRGVTDFAR